MKVIDLLNKIANNEEVPEKIKYEDDSYIHIGNYCYYCSTTNKILSDRIYAEQSKLNEEVEIIEEEKPKEIEFLGKQDLYIDDARGYSVNVEKIGDKVNELIRKVNHLLEKESDK